ncbi:MAG: type II secretion system GspH family protein [Opitutaceae bacterium]|jgi:prepilin-type N-terminal cleavage/methylation domain-containing protein|nr:type II secretion system GspH family protein [Opitutaceae bacterium]
MNTLAKTSRHSRRSRWSRFRFRAFTLVELLAVIVIIGILAAILLPVIGRVRSAARKSTCISNLRQIGVATYLYIEDNQGRMPDGGRGSAVSPAEWLPQDTRNARWPHQLQPYVSARNPQGYQNPLFHCPLTEPSIYTQNIDPGRGCYGMNKRLIDALPSEQYFRSQRDVPAGMPYNQISNPSRFLYLAEKAALDASVTGPTLKYQGTFPNLTGGLHPEVPDGIARNHDGIALHLMADGHVVALKDWIGAGAYLP